MYNLIAVRTPEDFKKIGRSLAADFQPPEVVRFLQQTLSTAVKALIVEAPYVDKDYRSTYYNYYAKKGLRYNPYCVRLHCFKEIPKLDEHLVLSHRQGVGYEAQLNRDYLGFIVVRPLQRAAIGRTVLAPSAISGFKGNVIWSEHIVHLLGRRFTVRGYPYMQQHTDIAVCAHVACWSILRHYSERYARHAEYLMHDITAMASAEDPGGLLPSRGLEVENARSILAKGGTYPDVCTKTEIRRGRDDEVFYRSLMSYVASGFPLFAAMENREHAITVVGYGLEYGTKPALKPSNNRYRYAWDYVQSLVVMDDNHPPYRTVNVSNTPQLGYSIRDITSFIVPLPDKVYLSAEAVMQHLENLFAGAGPFKFPKRSEMVIRTLLCTSAGFQMHLLKNRSAIPDTLFQACMELSMPQFIWLAEICDLQSWNDGVCNIRLVLDATANATEYDPFFVIQDSEKAFVYDRAVSRENVGLIQFRKPRSMRLELYKRNVDSFH